MSSLRIPLLALALALPAGSALAHTGHGAAGGLAAGLVHPLAGLDHLLAMVAVGMLGVQLGRRTLWLLPLTFMGVMLLGGLVAMGGVGLAVVELGILLSVLVLGALLTLGRNLPQALALALVAGFALFHGHAHGAEMPAAASGLLYGLGFLVATGALHGAGIALGLGLARAGSLGWLRYAGAVILVLGLGLAAG